MHKRLLLTAMITMGACNNDHSLGALAPNPGSDAGVAGAGDASAATPVGFDASPVANAQDARALGPLGAAESWTGYVENFQFPSGSDAIKLSIAYDAAGQVAGSVVFGNGTPPPPATDPEVGYPPGFGSQTPLFAPAEGYAFPITSGSRQTSRLRFALNGYDLWSGWCGLQPAPADGSDMCLPNWGWSAGPESCYQISPSGAKVTVDCGKLALCFMNRICACSPAGCVANTGLEVTFDMFVVDGTASGSLGGTIGGHNVHFSKDP